MINSEAESMINICISGPQIGCHVTQTMTTKDQSKQKFLLHTALCVIIQIKLRLKAKTVSIISTQVINMVPHLSEQNPLFSTLAEAI